MISKLKTILKPGITRQIVLLLLVSGIIPLLILAAVFFTFYFKGQKQAIVDIQDQIGDRIATSISSYVEKTSSQIQLFASTVNLETHSVEKLKTLSYALLDQIMEFDKITFVDLKGDEVTKISRYYTFRPFELDDIAPMESFQTARTGNIHISRVELSRFSKFPQIRISVPIIDVMDRMTGVLVVSVNVMKMWDYISKYSIGQNRYAYIVDSEGFLIAYQDISSVLQKKDLRNIKIVENLLKRETGVFEYMGLTGEWVIGVNRQIPLTGWGLIVETPVKDAYGNLYLLSGVFLAMFVFTLLLMVYLGFRFSFKGIILPIYRLEKEAEAITKGEFGRKINLKSENELGQLARAFNIMSEHIGNTTVSRDLLIQEAGERKKTEQALIKSEATLGSIFRAAPIGIGLVNDRILVWINDHMCSMVGYTRDELVGQNARLLYPDQVEYDRVGREKYGQIELQGTGTIETRWQRKDGGIIDVLLSSSPLDTNDLSMGVTFTVLDITDRKRAEDALRASGEIVRSIPSGLFVYQYEEDDRLILLNGNPASEKLTGINSEEFRGKEFNEIWPGARDNGVTEAFIKVMKSGRVYQTEDLHYKDNRLDGAFRIRAFPMPGRRLGVAFENITEQKQTELKRQELEDQLKQAHKIEAIGTMAGGIAHEFNNILGIILGNAELAVEDIPEWNPAKYCLEEIRIASLRAKDVIRQILSFARKTPATHKPINIATIVRESLKLIRATIPASVEIRQHILCHTEMILANPTEINQIIMNLCSNSVHSMKNETGILGVSLEKVHLDQSEAAKFEDLAPGEYVQFMVTDTGSGINPEIMDRIYDPYFTTKDVDEGLGMGLAVVYGIVKKHEGGIKFSSEVERGTTARLLFPISELEEVMDDKIHDELPMGSERILFVDDEASLVNVARQTLELQGYEVVGKTDSSEALELFQKEPDRFDLVITDMAMPGLSGKQLAREMINISPAVPIILCTGHSHLMDETRAKNSGFAAYAMKPLVKSEFVRIVRKVLDAAPKTRKTQAE